VYVGIPSEVIGKEFMFLHPYFKWLEMTDALIAYHIEMATGSMNYNNDMHRTDIGEKFLMADHQKFDKSVPAWLIHDASKTDMVLFDMTRVYSLWI
jgi:hypothetical protein